ncbi:MAG: type II toxin-antitoxin system VapC family toxin [Candidatus Kariarchaeaceae archaeon]|jgi:predicted nucleic acid-binding protein
MIVLDSDVLIEILDKESKSRDKIMAKLIAEGKEISTTSINLEEVLFGIFKSLNTQQLPESHPLQNFSVLPFTKEDAALAASIEVEMETLGKKKPRVDVMIASIVINNQFQLLSLNTKHFDDIPQPQLYEIK